MIYIIEGCDGVGKSTLAQEIAKQKGAHIIHCSYNKNWNIYEYHQQIIAHALMLQTLGIPVVIDRWAVSEHVYGEVFRDGESYNTEQLIDYYRNKVDITWIYCRNDMAAENHSRNKELRYEMFEDMTRIVDEYERFVKSTKRLNWITYDFTKNNINEFVGAL